MVSTFGVERIKTEVGTLEGREAKLDWTRFRTYARLDKKTDDSLDRYFHCFVAMCRRVCHLQPAHGEGMIIYYFVLVWGFFILYLFWME